ncbi:hypothetical protein BD779DRAFT_1513580 [Infundibulicybe gibba]|nr:hypothetical protein BD779DRAFT_1513580 [Infundibulicybe gibba]
MMLPDVRLMFSTAYLPHTLYSIAITSISIHLVSQRRASSDERARINAQISILQTISQQLRSPEPLSHDELERLRRLARPASIEAGVDIPKEEIGWKEVIFGQRKTQEDGMSEWDKKDLEKVQLDISKNEAI